MQKSGFLFRCLLAILIPLQLYAQETALFSLYQQNRYFYNPSFVGFDGNIMHFMYRNQWSGVQGAPENIMFTYQNAFSPSMGIGGRVYRDNAGVLSRTGAQMSYAYGVDFSRYSRLTFGMSIGAMLNNVRWDNLEGSDAIDPALYRINNTAVVDGAFGFNFALHNLNIGFAFPQLFNRNIREGTGSDFVRYANHSVATVSYRIPVAAGKFVLTPLVLYRIGGAYLNNAGQFDLNLKAEWNNQLWAGILHRTNYGSALSAGVNIGGLSFGYAYEFSNQFAGAVTNGSHELIVGYRFGSNPIHRTTAWNRIAPADTRVFEVQKRQENAVQEDAPLAIAEPTQETEEAVMPAQEAIATHALPAGWQKNQKFILRGLKFKKGSDVIQSGSFKELDALADILRQYTSVKIEVAGHTDNTGDPRMNLELSQARANAVKAYLEKSGIAAERVRAVGYGDQRPIASNDQELEGRELNRRVEIEVLEN
ncbi:PorP/SprF family type IX secretion system membrane protein [Rhodoflexus sp.]